MTVAREVYGPWAVIAGGSEGVGAEFARELAASGINLVLIARKEGPLQATAERVRQLGVEVRTVQADLIAPDMLETIRAATDDVEVGLFIYNAGSNTYRSEFVESDPAGVQRVIDLNITAPLTLTRHFGQRLKQRGRGGIMLLGSLGGFTGTAGIGIYAAAKAFLRTFTEGLWLELTPYGVDVLELSLGLTRTPAMERLGLDFDSMPSADPADVAREGLAHLADGPSWIASDNYEKAKQLASFPRTEVLAAQAESYRALVANAVEPEPAVP